jgi:hypothetical protein
VSRVRIPDEVLNALEAHVHRTSLRRTAGELGLSPTGLSMLLTGRQAQDRTLRKALAWYAAAAEQQRGPDNGTIHATLRLLVQHLPAESQDGAVRAITELVHRLSDEARVRPPAWTCEP